MGLTSMLVVIFIYPHEVVQSISSPFQMFSCTQLYYLTYGGWFRVSASGGGQSEWSVAGCRQPCVFAII